MEASRKATFVAAEKVICLVSAMMQVQVLNDDIGACDNLSVDTSSLDLPPFRNAPPQPTCDYSSVTAVPCDSDVVSQYSTSQDLACRSFCRHLHPLRKWQVLSLQ